MRIGWIVLAIVALNGTAAAEDVTVYITAEGTALTYGAKRVASSLFQKAGVAIAWRGPKPPVTGAPRTWLRVKLAEGTPDELLPGALAVSYPYAGREKSITVFFDRVRQQARGVERESALLAYVLVHEITHVIQGVDRHSQTGVMKARWSAEDLEAILARRLDFEKADVLMLQHGLAAGWRPEPATLMRRSESGIAVRPE